MRHRFRCPIDVPAALLAVVLIATVQVAAQQPAVEAPARPKPPAQATKGPHPARQWTAPRTPDGRPDLQGFWTNATFTPFERPVGLGGKEFFSEEEAAAYERKRLDDEESQPQDDVHYDNVIWMRERLPKVLSNRRTSLVVDPPDGRVPPLIPDARQRAAARTAMRKASSQSDVQSRSLTERCIIWPHVGPPMLPTGYNSNLQIVQNHDLEYSLRAARAEEEAAEEAAQEAAGATAKKKPRQ